MKDVKLESDHHLHLSVPRKYLNELLFDTRTLAGRVTNWGMLSLIMVVVIGSMVNTVDVYNEKWGEEIHQFERWVLYAFAVEYVLRVYAARNRRHYLLSFNGIVDLITVLPLFIVGDSFVLVRLLRLARVIRVAISFPVVRSLFASLKGSLKLLMGVLGTIGLISVMVGNLIYILEPQTYSNAFEGTWWSLVTMSTVGYGDFVPQTAAGKMLAASLIMSGICMFAMVTAVISVKVGRMINNSAKCVSCNHGIAPDYLYCPHCATEQEQAQPELFEEDDA
ncbi:potassium voltage-gated channel Shal-related subfamily D member 2 [Mariprofundus micogutta]|uniref:Potassium voltage-gated channel Shal-related subfamily D member 2 n=1 Tax=Mariprofundus micogutta TaxID=1921010 RepID=A0A1L8CLJ2_9PROT|nr:ion transporter [Mariprofundus micogutta]GAV19709.1 potassium voltage-gated channel Shal-related subfamily D member 2 [Mariprofundus micogutta]